MKPSSVKRRIRRFSKLEPNWNSYGAVPVTPDAIDDAITLIERSGNAIAWDGVSVDAAPGPDGGVLVEWDGGDRRLQVWRMGNGTYAGVAIQEHANAETDFIDRPYADMDAALAELAATFPPGGSTP